MAARRSLQDSPISPSCVDNVRLTRRTRLAFGAVGEVSPDFFEIAIEPLRAVRTCRQLKGPAAPVQQMDRACPALVARDDNFYQITQNFFRLQIAGLGKHFKDAHLAAMKIFQEPALFHLVLEFAGTLFGPSDQRQLRGPSSRFFAPCSIALTDAESEHGATGHEGQTLHNHDPVANPAQFVELGPVCFGMKECRVVVNPPSASDAKPHEDDHGEQQQCEHSGCCFHVLPSQWN